MIKTSFRTATFLAVAGGIAFSAPAMAQSGDRFDPESGIYVSLQVGVSSPTDETFAGVQAPEGASPGVAGAPANVSLEYDEDFVGTAAVGYQFATHVFGLFQPSIELEYSYSEIDVEGGSFNGGNQTFGGEVKANTFAINLLSDLRWSNTQRVIPFVGAGLGIADVDVSTPYFPNNGVANAPTFAVTGSSTGFLYQADAGIRYAVTPKLDLQTRVRYQRVDSLDFERVFVAGGAHDFNANVNGDYETVNVLAGVRYRF